MAVPETIDPRAINKAKDGKITIFKKHENLTLAINSAKVVCSIDAPLYCMHFQLPPFAMKSYKISFLLSNI